MTEREAASPADAAAASVVVEVEDSVLEADSMAPTEHRLIVMSAAADLAREVDSELEADSTIVAVRLCVVILVMREDSEMMVDSERGEVSEPVVMRMSGDRTDSLVLFC